MVRLETFTAPKDQGFMKPRLKHNMYVAPTPTKVRVGLSQLPSSTFWWSWLQKTQEVRQCRIAATRRPLPGAVLFNLGVDSICISCLPAALDELDAVCIALPHIHHRATNIVQHILLRNPQGLCISNCDAGQPKHPTSCSK